MLQNGLSIARLLHHIQSAGQPVYGMFLPMPPDDIAVGLDLRRAFVLETLLNISPGQENDDHISVHRLIGLHAEISQAHLGFAVEVDRFAGPAPLITLQGLLGRASESRTREVRRGMIPGVPSRYKNADIEGNLFQMTSDLSHKVGGLVSVRSGHLNMGVPPVP